MIYVGAGLADYMSKSGECCFEPNEKRKTCKVQFITDSESNRNSMIRIELNPKPGQYVCDPPNTRRNISIPERPGKDLLHVYI